MSATPTPPGEEDSETPWTHISKDDLAFYFRWRGESVALDEKVEEAKAHIARVWDLHIPELFRYRCVAKLGCWAFPPDCHSTLRTSSFSRSARASRLDELRMWALRSGRKADSSCLTECRPAAFSLLTCLAGTGKLEYSCSATARRTAASRAWPPHSVTGPPRSARLRTHTRARWTQWHVCLSSTCLVESNRVLSWLGCIAAQNLARYCWAAALVATDQRESGAALLMAEALRDGCTVPRRCVCSSLPPDGPPVAWAFTAAHAVWVNAAAADPATSYSTIRAQWRR